MSPDDQRPTAALEVVVTDQHGRRLRKPALVRWLQTVAPPRARGVLSVAFVTDRAMRRINREFAKHDYVTDVLSFRPIDEVRKSGSPEVRRSKRGDVRTSMTPGPPASRAPGPSAEHHLGDIVIATGRARRQANEAGHSVRTEVRVLALHGLLHLLGYDHATDGGQMARLEARLRRKGGLREGLIERAGGS